MNADARTIGSTNTGETRAGSVRFPLWLVAVCGAFSVWVHLNVSDKLGGFDRNVFYPVTSTNELAILNPPPKVDPLLVMGKEVFSLSCVPCHQLNGQGLPGQFPPLEGSEWVLAPGPNRIIRIVLHGFQGPVTVKGQEFNNVMVPWKDTLSDEQIAAVLTYVRQEWGNSAPPVVPEQVKTIRDREKERDTSWFAEELLKIPESD
jgi:mono/diheme cytochrome c family protein